MKRAPVALPEPWESNPFITRLARFAGLTETELSALWRIIETVVRVKKRHDLVVDGYEYRKLCFVEEGFAARYKLLRNGKRQIVNFVLPGEVIGLPGSFLERARYSVVALTELKLRVCTLDAYVRLCYQHPKCGLALSWLAVHEAVTCAEHAISTGRRTPIERLAHFLLEMHSRLALIGLVSSDGFDLPLSQEIMSDAVGLSVPHFNRTLGALRLEGLLTMDGGRVQLLDRPALERLGHFQPVNMMVIPAEPGLRHPR